MNLQSLRGALLGVLVLLSSACGARGPFAAFGFEGGLGTVPPAYVPPSPPADPVGEEVFRAAGRTAGRKILISLQDRFLWLVEGEDTLLSAPVAIGKNEDFRWGDKHWRFETPQGRRNVGGKAIDPLWAPPEWHYLEIAADRDLEPVYLKPGQRVSLADGTVIEVRGADVGRINAYGNFWPFTPGTEIIFDEKIFIPPFGTSQRRVPGTLGTRKLDIGDGYLIHGTDERESIGRPVSHGCVRMRNEDVERLYEMVGLGTPVFLY